MRPKLISQTGLKVRTNCRLGFYSFVPALTQAQEYNNKCIKERDDRSLSCFINGIFTGTQVGCKGTENSDELDRCMKTVWGLEDFLIYEKIYKPQ